MSRKPLIIIGVVLASALVAFGGWYFLIRSDAPDAPDAASARDALEIDENSTTTLPGETTADSDSGDSGSDTGAAATGVDGSWTVDTTVGGDDINARSYVGYKVDEELLSIGSATAFGRSPEVSGTLVIEGTTATAADIEADLTALESDSGLRDRALGSQALETDDFPTASFTLTQPIEFGAVPDGETVLEATAVGDLTLHGVTGSLEIALEAQLIGDIIAVTGVAPVVYADFDIDPPSAPAVASVEDNGTIEIQLFFTKS